MEQANCEEEVTTETLNAGDELLSIQDITAPEIPEDILFPDELNRYLRERIQHLTQQNGMLQKTVQEHQQNLHASEAKIEELHKKLSEYQNISKNGFATAASASCNKIAELSKKLREKNSEIEVLKTKYSRAEKLLKEYSEKPSKEEAVESNVPEKDETHVKLDKIKSLQEKLSSTSIKLFDVKNQNMQLRNDLKLATKLLQQEIGESFDTLQNLVSLNPNWRGRAQVICDLQQKVAELREKLKEKETGKELNKSASNFRCRIEKRTEILMNENKELRQTLEDNKRKLEATKARCRVLETECSNIRAKLNATSSQNGKDHELISSLMEQISSLRTDHTSAIKQKQKDLDRMQQTIKNLKAELYKEKSINENLQTELNDREIKTETHIEKIPEGANQYEKIVSKMEAEKMRLLELLEITNTRLEKERDSHGETQTLYRIERQRVAKLESKMAKLQLEWSDKSSVYSGHSNLNKQTQNSLEDQLELAEENIRALQTRLDLEKQERKTDFLEFSKLLQNYRQL